MVDLGATAIATSRIAAELIRPPALFRNMTGRQVRLTALLDGPFGTARFVYRLTAPRIAFDQTGFEEVRAEGRGRLSRAPVTVPVAGDGAARDRGRRGGGRHPRQSARPGAAAG